MDFIDVRVPFRVRVKFDEHGTLIPQDTTVRVHMVGSAEAALQPALKRICGGVLFDAAPALEDFAVKLGEKDGALQTLEITFKGEQVMGKLNKLFETRKAELEKCKPESGKAKPQFVAQAEEALYYALITKADLQIEVAFEGAKDLARVILALDYYQA